MDSPFETAEAPLQGATRKTAEPAVTAPLQLAPWETGAVASQPSVPESSAIHDQTHVNGAPVHTDVTRYPIPTADETGAEHSVPDDGLRGDPIAPHGILERIGGIASGNQASRLMLVLGLTVVLLVYILMYDLVGTTIFAHDPLDSYTLQALRWRAGAVALERNYDYLELALYNGSYFVSFPPVPAIPMLLLTFLFGENTPNNLMTFIYTLTAFGLLFRAFDRMKATPTESLCWATVFVFGSNIASISMYGGVWYQAQTLAFALSVTAAVLAWERGMRSRIAAMACLALAVGCRPFQIVYFPILLLVMIRRDRDENDTGFMSAALRLWPVVILPVLIGGAYAAYNVVRFGNPLEFGHNHLPEFTEAMNGQFSLSYLPVNFFALFFRFPSVSNTLQITLPPFDGFAFYLANPIFTILFFWFIRDIISRKMTMEKIVLLSTMTLHTLLLMMHKSFGGWQFGARYMIDLIPFILIYFMLDRRTCHFKRWEAILGIFAVAFNVYGCLAQFLRL